MSLPRLNFPVTQEERDDFNQTKKFAVVVGTFCAWVLVAALALFCMGLLALSLRWLFWAISMR